MAITEQEKMRRFRRKPLLKLTGGIILLIVLSVLYWGYLFASSFFVNVLNSVGTRAYQMKALSQSTEKGLSLLRSVLLDVEKRHLDKVTLEAAACAALAENGMDLEPCMYQNGAIVRIEDGSVGLPEDFPKDINIDAKQFQNKSNIVIAIPEGESQKLSIVYYCMIDSPYYYFEWETYDELEQEQTDLFDYYKALAGIEKALNVNLLLFPAKGGIDGKHSLIYVSEAFHENGFTKVEDFGITQEMIAEADRNRLDDPGAETEGAGGARAAVETEGAGSARSAAETERVSYQYMAIGDQIYEFYLRKYDSTVFGETLILACLFSLEGSLQIQNETQWIILAVFFIIGMFFLVWYCATLRLVRDHSLNDRQKRELSFRIVIRRSASIIGIGCVIILFTCAMLFALVRLFSTTQQVETAFSSLQQRLEENSYESGLTESTRKKSYEVSAQQIARILENQPDFAKPEKLQYLCDLLKADYIMLFDSEGNETLSNSRYVGLSLGTDPSSSTYDFRRLLTGTKLITHDLAVDEATGEEHVMIGVSYGLPEEGENYEALLLAVPGKQIYESAAESIDDVMSSLTVRGLTAYSVDPETHLILHASKPSLVGKNVLDLGLPETALHGGWRGFHTVDQKPSFIECEEKDSVLYFYSAEQSQIYSGVWVQSFLSAVPAVIFLAVLALFLLFGYGKFFALWSEVGRELREEKDEIQLSDGRHKYSRDPSVRWNPDIEAYGIHGPFRLARLVTIVLLVIGVFFLWTRAVFSGDSSGESLFSFIIQGNWTKGINLFAFTSILVLLFEVLFAVVLIRTLLRMISSALGTRGETFCRLLTNLTSYGGIIFFVYYTFYYLGFQPNTLLASLGLSAFAISLGAKDLITDVIAGLSIVFEGEFQVGDIIEVGGYRGEVLEIGVRTTKLEGRGGNIKIISNRDIKNVVNMTLMNSWYPLEVSISGDLPLEKIESLLNEQLPNIGKSIPEILSGPFYRGVVSMGKGTMTLSIIAECNEGNYFTVQRSLNRSIQELFADHEIKIM